MITEPTDRLICTSVPATKRLSAIVNKIQSMWIGGEFTVKPSSTKSPVNIQDIIDIDSLPEIDEPTATRDYCHKVILPIDILRELTYSIAEIYPKCSIVLSGNYEYPEGGYMGWHTNSNSEALRMYISCATGESAFRYMENGEAVDSIDRIGWNFRLFNISKESPLWHCVWAKSPRLSIGFRIIDNL